MSNFVPVITTTVPHFENKEDFMHYLENYLIRANKESGQESTAEDFEEALYWLKRK